MIEEKRIKQRLNLICLPTNPRSQTNSIKINNQMHCFTKRIMTAS